MDYLLLTNDMKLEHAVKPFRGIKEFDLAKYRFRRVADNYYVKEGFGLYTNDGEKALSHAVHMLKDLCTELENEGQYGEFYINKLFEDLHRVLETCIGDVENSNEVIPIIFEVLAYLGFTERIPEFVESYYNGYYLDLAKEDCEPERLDYYDLYTQIGDYELFGRGNAEQALRFYRVADLDWLLLRDETTRVSFEVGARLKMKRKKWHETVKYYEKIYDGTVTSEELLSETEQEKSFWNKYRAFRRAKKSGDMHHISTAAEQCIQAGLAVLKDAEGRETQHRDILISMHSIRRNSIFQTICVLGQDAEADKPALKEKVLHVMASFQDGKQGLIGSYVRNRKITRNLDKTVYLLCEAVQMAEMMKGALLVQKINQDMAYYTSLETMMYLTPGKAQNETAAGKLSVMHIAYMNDPNEGKILDKYLYGDHRIKGWEESRKSAEFPFVFMKCFTSLVDDLPMWEMYGNHAEGCCIVLDWAKTIKNLPKKAAVPLYRICYVKRNKKGTAYSINNDDNPNIPELNSFKKSMSRLAEIAKEVCQDAATENVFAGLMEDITYLFKNSDYSHEQEMRILYHKEPNDDAIQHTSGDFPMLYVLMEHAICIKEIIFGPKCPDMTRRIPYIQEKLYEMCQKTGMSMPRLTVSAIEYI